MSDAPEILFVCPTGEYAAEVTAAATDGTAVVQQVDTGSGALDVLATHSPSCVVIDGEPPDMTSSELVETIRATTDDVSISAFVHENDTAFSTLITPDDRDLARYETILDTVNDGIYQFDPAGRFVELNDAVAEITGYARSELLGEHISIMLDESDVAKGESLIQELLESDERDVATMDMTVHTADGEEIPCENRLSVIQTDGEFRGTVGVVRDISERAHRKAQLKQERDLRERLLETSPVGIVVIDEAGTVARANDRASEILGVPKDALTEQSHSNTEWNVFDESGEPIPGSSYPASRVFETGEPVYDWEAEMERPDGSTVWLSFNGAPLFDAEGNVERVILVIEDVTQQKQRERQLHQQTAFVEGIFNAVPDPMYTFNGSGRMIRWNEGFTEATGYSDDEVEGMHALSFVPDEDEEKITDAISRVIQDKEVQNVESALVRKDGTHVPHEFSGGPVLDDDGNVTALTGVGRDVTDRIERERQIADQRDELEELHRINAVIRDIDQRLIQATSREAAEQAVCDRLAAADAYQFATIGSYDDEFASFVVRARAGVDDSVPHERSAMDDFESPPGEAAIRTGDVQVVRDGHSEASAESDQNASVARSFESVASIPITYEDTTYGVLSVYSDRASAFDDRERAVLAELGETLGHVITTIQQEKRERILTALQDATRELIHADSKAEVSERVVDAASDVLDATGVGIFLFDPDERALTPTATTDRLRELYGDWEATLGADESAAWTTFLDGSTVVYGDLDAELDQFSDTDARSGLFAPLGDHGVFVALSAERRAFDDDITRVLDLFAATAEATLDRVEGDRELRAHDRKLQKRNRQLTHLKGINDIIRELDQSIIHASTRQEIEREVCDRLAQYDQFEFVWIGKPDWGTDRIEPRAWAGNEQGYLDAIPLDIDGSNTLPTAETLETESVTYVADPATRLRDDPWRTEALKRDYQAVVSVPLVYGDINYGALTVYTADPTTLDEMSRAVIEELGETIGHAINAIKTRRGILSDQAVELELEVYDEGVFHHLAASLDAEIEVTDLVPETEGHTTAFFTVEGVTADEVHHAASTFVNISDVTLLSADDDRLRFRASVTGQTVPNTVIEYGARPQQISVDATRTTVVVELPSETNVRPFIEKLKDHYESVELVARRDRTEGGQSHAEFTEEFERTLTDRQLEVLKTAYSSGFFESPKEQTGTEIAESLDITQPTFNHHLRVAQRKLLRALLGER
ncbi:PAS domain S-box protein [Halorientalis brevis]|uniref:PAS domain S-box protein n=1 Tax=Halorientalis brevis TaxID=1126241 RepID=A0ABD6CHQ4_9EURY|nr:PAS domain S-box protein [Halorientalis brevis]